ncbi:oxidoreductase [Cohnella luojiensis]|uniref:SDR family NAD(P)-dependent oxidoreductase n=1 Tax=Cohnella luojiensis TaxID=652876 RepID=A0A4Y8LP18_9BACL|nr:oxidoreductase [Cohnella luojiensis]TFE22673.1 SDR family NAD(P)-dependent oxidoreductase [Cohnella luojiensis]
MSTKQRVWFITGTSTGLGRSLAEKVIAHGDRLAAAARNIKDIEALKELAPDRVLTLKLDVHNEDEARKAVSATLDAFGQIDVLVNNAGYGLLGAFQEVTDEQVRNQFDTNVFGLMNVTRAVLPALVERRSGHILNISSILGLTSYPGFSVYSASKYAVEGFTVGLAHELAALGVKVTAIEPGAFRTKWATTTLEKAPAATAAYSESSGGVRSWLTGLNGAQPGDPERAADIMIKLVETENPPLHLVLGRQALQDAKDKIGSLYSSIEKWADVTISGDFDEPVVDKFPQ